MNINRVVLTGNLTRDPDVRSTPGGLSICKLGIAVNGRRKNNSTGMWEDKANFFRITVFGGQADSCGKYLKKGNPVAIDGRLEWSEYEVDGQKRQSVDIIADNVQFLPRGEVTGSGSGNGSSGSIQAPESDIPADTSDFEAAPVAAGASDDDIPF